MITVIVFSKDRPAQLDLFLTSLMRNQSNVLGDIRILYTYSNEEYKRGYDIIKEEWGGLVFFCEEENFCKDTKRLIESSENRLCFMTDDDIFYRQTDITESNIRNFFNEIEAGCFSFRLGTNTLKQYCNPFNAEVPNFMANFEDKILIWNKDLLNMHKNINFTYILSVNGHVFRQNTIMNLVNIFEFRNPNQLESGLQKYSFFLSPIMGCQQYSSLVNVPVNLVNVDFKNPHGLEFMQDQKSMNDKFLQGLRIKLEDVDLSNVIGTHQEFNLPMSKA